MNSLILLGGGGHCISVLDTVQRMGSYDEIVILDQPSQIGKTVLNYEIAGSDDTLPQLVSQGYRDVFITVGGVKDSVVRRKLGEKVRQAGLNLVNIIDPSAIISAHTKLGKGVFIGKQVVINAGSHISDMAIINTGSIIEHENTIGEYTHVAVGAVLCGGVTVGCDCLIGANATVLQGVHIGSHSIVGAGSLIVKDIPEYSKIYGSANV